MMSCRARGCAAARIVSSRGKLGRTIHSVVCVPRSPTPAAGMSLCRFGHSLGFTTATALDRNFSSLGCLSGRRWHVATDSSCLPTSAVRLNSVLGGSGTPILKFSIQVRSYSRHSEDGSPSPVPQKGKYTRGLGVKPAETESRKDIVPQKVRIGRSETLTKYYATCAPGLENVLAAELSSSLIGAQEVEVGSAGVSFVGSQGTGYKASLWLRTAVRVLVQLAAGPLPSGRGQYDPVYIFIRDAVDWPSILVDDSAPETQQQDLNRRPSEQYRPRSNSGGRDNETLNTRTRTAIRSSKGPRFRNFAVQSRVWNCSDISNSNFASVRAKDAICDALRDTCGGHRPEPPEQGGSTADVPLFLSLYRDSAILYRDLSGVSLHKRGYRDVMHKASLNEGIAAAVLTIAGWNQAVSGFGASSQNALGKERVLLDPMCGSGTFLIEAALMASNVAPGLMRRHWPFQTWHDFDQSAWRQCKDAALSAKVSSLPGVRLLGNDIHEGALSLCRKDAETAGVLHLLDLSCEDCQNYRPPVVPSLVVTNPPWGDRLTDSSNEEKEWLYTTWQGLGRFVKAQCSCADVYVLSGNAEVTRAMHMRADKKWPLTIGVKSASFSTTMYYLLSYHRKHLSIPGSFWLNWGQGTRTCKFHIAMRARVNLVVRLGGNVDMGSSLEFDPHSDEPCEWT